VAVHIREASVPAVHRIDPKRSNIFILPLLDIDEFTITKMPQSLGKPSKNMHMWARFKPAECAAGDLRQRTVERLRIRNIEKHQLKWIR